LDSLAPLCDFFAVGTNDLIQYTLAAGRLNDEVADLYNPMHPAILKSLLRIQQVAARFGKDVTVCGEMAANPLHAAVLIGLGYRKLSMTSYAIPRVREVIRTTSSAVLEELCRDLMVQRSLAEVTAFVVSRLLPEVGKGLTESRSH
jgi:phosphotransferase system enzyme I (PtsI)